MNYVLIESFCALAKRLNFTKAAADIFTTQPSLSRNIVTLENELGFQLFHRSKHSVSLTELGQKFLPYAQAIKDANDKAVDFAASIVRNAPNTLIWELRVGVATSLFTRFLPAMVAYMSSEIPHISFSVIDGLQSDILREFREGKLDLIMTERNSLESEKGLDTLLVRRNYMKLVVPAWHPATQATSPIPLSRLPEYGQPILTVDTTLYYQLHKLLPSLEIKQLRSATHSVTLMEAGLGISICQEGLRDIFPSSVVFLDLEGDPLYMDAVVAWSKDAGISSWRGDFLQALSAFIQQYAEEPQPLAKQ